MTTYALAPPSWTAMRRFLPRPRDLLVLVAGALFLAGAYSALLPFSVLESWGFVTGATCVWLASQNRISSWPVGIANAIFFIVLFADARLYADMGLQVYFVATGICGWWLWLRGGERRSRLPIRRTPLRAALALAGATAAATVVLMFYLRSIGGAAPFLDALTACSSLAAQWMLMRRWIENWFVWIAVDVVSIGLYIWKDLALTAVLYGVFLLICLSAVRSWRRELKAQQTAQPPEATGMGAAEPAGAVA